MKEYGGSYCGAYLPVVVGELTRLQAVAGGGPDTVKWKDHVAVDVAFAELHVQVEDTLAIVDLNVLIAQTKSCAQATPCLD